MNAKINSSIKPLHKLMLVLQLLKENTIGTSRKMDDEFFFVLERKLLVDPDNNTIELNGRK
jgi:hypothetical protein